MTDTTLLDTQTETASANGAEPHSDWIETDDEAQMRQLIMQKQDRPEKLVPVPEWGMKVLVRAMSGTQRALYEDLPRHPETKRLQNTRHAYAEMVRWCCCHPRTKKPIFVATDRDELMDQHNGAIIDELATWALRLSGLLPMQQEQVAKNSEATPTSTATTDSPSDLATNA